MNANQQIESIPRTFLPLIAFAEGFDKGFDLIAFASGYADFLAGRPYSDRVLPDTRCILIFIPPCATDRPLSWAESYRAGWIAASQSLN